MRCIGRRLPVVIDVVDWFAGERLFMREELKTIVAFVEGNLDAKEFERQLYAHSAGFEEVLNNDPDLPPGYLEQGVYLFIIQQDFDRFSDVLDVHGALQNYLARNGIASDATGAYSKFFKVLLEAQPGWLNVVDSDYFLKEVLPGAGERAGDELKEWLHEQLLERFQYVNEPPNWIQGPDWPITENGPLVFLGEVEVEKYFHDDAAAYVFYDPASGICETILQVA